MANKRFILLCAIIGFLAVSGMGKPFNLILDGLANKTLSKSVSGDIVLVTYDESKVKNLDAVETILNLGADGVLSTSPLTEADKPWSHSITYIYHSQKRVEPNTFELPVQWWRGIEVVNELGIHSTPVEFLAGKNAAESNQPLRVDYVYDADSIPSYSYSDVTSQSVALNGKQVVLVDKFRPGPDFNIPGRPAETASTVLIIAAETLKNDSLTHIPPSIFLILFAGLFFALLSKRKAPITLITLGAIGTIALTFIALRSAGFYSGLGIAFVAIVAIAIYTAFQRKREKSFDSNFRHHSALTDRLSIINAEIIAICIKSYRRLLHGTDPKHVEKFMREVEQRLSVAAAGSEIFELEPGVFSWTMRISDDEELQNHLEAARLILREPIMLGSQQLSLSVAFGIDGEHKRSLVDRFGSALIAASDAERAGLAYKRSDSKEVEAHKEDLILIGEVEDAIKAVDIFPVFQPKVCLESLKVVGFEALARWKHAKRGMLSPAVFIPLIEGNGKSNLLARHMLRTSLQYWADLEMSVPLSVNISPTSLMGSDFVSDVKAALASAGLPASLLVLEIVETEALSNNSKTEERLNELCDLGIKLSIDDFGTGYSTLDNVRRLPAKELKLDKKFIDDIGTSDISERLVSTTYKMGSELGLSVVAEGIETLEQLAKLQSIGIHIGQGYYFAKPMHADEINEYLSSVFRRSQSA